MTLGPAVSKLGVAMANSERDRRRGARPPADGRARGPRREAVEKRPPLFGLRRVNLLLLSLAAGAIVGGYLLLNRGSVTAAPILLVLGYAVLIPVGLLAGNRRSED